MPRTLKRLGIRHQAESGELFTADRNLRMDIVGEVVSGTLLTGSMGRSPSCWTSPMLTLKRRYTCEEGMLITMDQLPFPPRRAGANTALVRDMCPLTKGVINLSLQQWKAWGVSG